MSNNKDLVVKMTINSTDFEKGIKNAKSGMNNLQNSAKRYGSEFKSSIGGITKALGALGIAMSMADGLKSFIHTTETMSDAWDNAIEGMKQSFNVSMQQLMSNDHGFGAWFQGIMDEFSSMFANDAGMAISKAMDASGTAGRRYSFVRDMNSGEFAEAMMTMRDKNASAEDKKKAEDKARKIISDMQKQANNYTATLYNQISTTLAGLSGIDDFNNMSISDLKQIVSDFSLGRQSQSYGSAIDAWLNTPGADLNENNTIKGLEDLIRAINATQKEIADMTKQVNRTSGSAPTTVTTPKPKPEAKVLTADQQAIYESRAMAYASMFAHEFDKAIEEYTPFIEDEEIYEADTEQITASVIESLNKIKLTANDTATALGYMTSIFGSLSDIMGDTSGTKAFLASMAAVASGAQQMIQVYTSLASIKTVEEAIAAGEGIPGPYKIIAIAGYAAAALATIANIKNAFAGSFANGGIVGGNSYSGDKLIARVNSGEMILNRSQQSALFGNGGGNVHFIIEGSQLKGVLDNYNKTKAL